MSKSNIKSFTLQVKVVAVVDYNIQAKTMQEAIELFKEASTMDIIERNDGYNDYRHALVGVFGGEDWDTDARS
jgi:hypothetical protein